MKQDFIKGISYGWDGRANVYRTERAKESMKLLSQTGANWVAISFNTYQERFNSTHIYYEYGHTVTDLDIITAIHNAHNNNLKVCLKPVVDPKDKVWRGFINFPDENNAKVYWDEWFESYRAFICHYAQLAEQFKCEMFCVGCEYKFAQRKDSYWSEIIDYVKEIYHGKIIYNANFDRVTGCNWFNKLDYIGVSAYYSLTQKVGASEEELKEGWKQVLDDMRKIYREYNKPVVFMETGCMNAKGACIEPWNYDVSDRENDEEEQARFIKTSFETFADEEGFLGYFWWEWLANLYDPVKAKSDIGYCFYSKKAEEIVREWYRK